MVKLLLILLVALVFETLGVICLSKGLKTLEMPRSYGAGEIISLIGRGASNPYLLAGVFFEAIFFAGLLILMANADVSFVWPMTSLSFVFSTLAARYFLHEQVDTLRWMGVLLIMCGAGLIIFTEKQKERIKPGTVEMRSSEYPRV